MNIKARSPIRTISLLARGDVGRRIAISLARDRRVRVVSYYTDSIASDLRRLFPKARRRLDVTTSSYADHCRREVDCILSIHCNVILPEKVFKASPHAFNLHPGFLPFGRGYWPTYWAIADGSPAGPTIHRMAVKVDRGPVIAQRRVPVLPTDDGETLTRRVNRAEIGLFLAFWPKLRDGRYREFYPKGAGTYHSRAEGLAVRELRPGQKLPVGALLDRIRAFTDSRFGGCFIRRGGKKIFLKLSLREDARK